MPRDISSSVLGDTNACPRLHEHREWGMEEAHKPDLAGAQCKSSRMNMGILKQPSVQSVSGQAGHGVTQQLHFLMSSEHSGHTSSEVT